MDLEHCRRSLPRRYQIVDIFHARQHLWDVARELYPGQEAEQKRWMAPHQDELLDQGLKSFARLWGCRSGLGVALQRLRSAGNLLVAIGNLCQRLHQRLLTAADTAVA